MKQPSPGMFRWSYILVSHSRSRFADLRGKVAQVLRRDRRLPPFSPFSGKEKKALTYRRASALGTLSYHAYLTYVRYLLYPKKLPRSARLLGVCMSIVCAVRTVVLRTVLAAASGTYH